MRVRWLLCLVLASLAPSLLAADLVFWGPGSLAGVRAIAIAPNGDIWAGGAGQIAIYAPDGRFRAYAPSLKSQYNAFLFVEQGDLLVAPNGGDVFLLHDGNTRAFAGKFASWSPWDIAPDDQGSFYAADTGNGLIKKFDQRATVNQLQLTFAAPDTDKLTRPYSLAAGTGRLFVSAENQPGLWVFTADGKFERRLFPDRACFRVRRGPEGIYVMTSRGLVILHPETGATVREVPTLKGSTLSYHGTMGFAVDGQGNLYVGAANESVVRKYAPDGTLLLTCGADYKATLTVPENWIPGETVTIPAKIEALADTPVGKMPPTFTFGIEPALLPGEPDSNFKNAMGFKEPGTAWEQQRRERYAALGRPLPATASENTLQVTLPAETPANLYRLVAHADHGSAEGKPDQELLIGVAPRTAGANLTLYLPRQRTVFQQGEKVEVNAIIRSAVPLPAGALTFALAPRHGEELAYQPNAPAWKRFPIAAMSTGTLTFRIDAGGIAPGRYQLQATYTAGEQTLTDRWPLQIVGTVPATRFRILFPEWSAGYTDNLGPFTGAGMRADAARLAREGINLCDVEILARSQQPSVNPTGFEGQRTATLMTRAAGNPALPAPERFLVASTLEIEMQEALRNGYGVQRDVWGGWWLPTLSHSHPLGLERDNRLLQLHTQWQREWPSWLGHRFFSLSSDSPGTDETKALLARLQGMGLTPPTEKELQWARNTGQRRFISDSPLPTATGCSTIGADAAGRVYLGSRGSVLACYEPDGKLCWFTRISGDFRDMAVAPDGTVAIAHTGAFTLTTPDGKTTRSFPAVGLTDWSPKGICFEPAGTLLLSDTGGHRVCRFSREGKLLDVVADKTHLVDPNGIAVLKDGTLAVADAKRGGVVLLSPANEEVGFIKSGGTVFGGKFDVYAAPDDTLWLTNGGYAISRWDRTGKQLGTVSHNSLSEVNTTLCTSIAMTPKGNLLLGCVSIPYGQEVTIDGDAVRQYGLGTQLLDVRLDRQRYTWADRINASLYSPLPWLRIAPLSTLQAFVRPGAEAAWTPLAVTPTTLGDYVIAVPKVTGEVTLRLVWAPAGATADHPQAADFPLTISERVSPEDQQRLADLLAREVAWKEAWARARGESMVRWTRISDKIRPGTQNTAPTNYGTIDTLGCGIWVPYRRDALVAEAENEGHDHGAFPVMGPYYVARALEGPNPKPAWSSLLHWFWNSDQQGGPTARPTRDTIMLLGAGASGIGTGKLVTAMTDTQLAMHRKMVDRLQRLGEATLACDLPGRGGVAVLHSFTQEAMDAYDSEHFYTAHAAWYDLLRAHIPTAIVCEETIEKGGLLNHFKAVLLPGIHFPLPPATLAALERFRAAGGEIWADLGTRITVPGMKTLRTLYRPYWADDRNFTFVAGTGPGTYDGNYEYVRMKQGSDARLPALKEAFGKLAIAAVTTEDANIFLQERRAGDAVYLFAGNDHYPDKPLYQTHLAGQTPVPATATFTLRGGAIYDALAMRPLAAGPLTVKYTDEEPASLWVVLPQPLGKLTLTAAQQGANLTASIQPIGADGKPLKAAIPLEITITDAAGVQQAQLWRSTNAAGLCQVALPLGWQASAGAWTVTARELLTGKLTATARATIAAAPAAVITQETAPVLVFDRSAILAWLQAQRGNEVWIALDKEQAALQPAAEGLAAILAQRGLKARVINIADLPETPLFLAYNMPPEQQDVFAQLKAGQAVGLRRDTENKLFSVPGPARVIMRPLILLGEPAKNRWLKDIQDLQLTPRQLTPSYPGPGRALLQYAWAPFYDGYDAVTISATDLPGLQAGIAALTAL